MQETAAIQGPRSEPKLSALGHYITDGTWEWGGCIYLFPSYLNNVSARDVDPQGFSALHCLPDSCSSWRSMAPGSGWGRSKMCCWEGTHTNGVQIPAGQDNSYWMNHNSGLQQSSTCTCLQYPNELFKFSLKFLSKVWKFQSPVCNVLLTLSAPVV